MPAVSWAGKRSKLQGGSSSMDWTEPGAVTEAFFWSWPRCPTGSTEPPSWALTDGGSLLWDVGARP